jgi:hypothetical protein
MKMRTQKNKAKTEQTRKASRYSRERKSQRPGVHRKNPTTNFFGSQGIEQLAEAQGVSPLKTPGDLAGGWPADEDIDEFVETTYRGRS